MSTTKISTTLLAQFTGQDNVKPTQEWKRIARERGFSKGYKAAREHAGTHGAAVMVWANGHTALYVLDNDSGDIIRIKFNGEAATSAETNRQESEG